MDWITKLVCIMMIVFVAGMLVAIITNSVKSCWYDDVRDLDDMLENKRAVNHTDKESDNKRADYLFCVRNINIIATDDISNSMCKIDKYLTLYKLEQFNRFYTVYCKELSDILKAIKDCKCSSLCYSLVVETKATYGGIFSKMLADVETFIKNNSASVTDIEGIKNFAKINGDFDENYKAETVDNSVSDTSTILTSTTSAVENSAKNYANALTHAYEKVRQYKEENEQLTKELEKCRAEAKKHIDTTNSADKLKSDLARIDEVISCQERAGRNDSTLELMRTVRRQIAETGILHGKDNYTDYKLYCWGIPIEDYLNVWEVEFDYTHDYFYYE